MNEIWGEQPATGFLTDREVHVWLAHLRSAHQNIERLRSVLSDEENSRAEKFHFLEHRERWQMTRGILRILLGAYVEIPTNEIAFQYGAQGKPKLKYCESSGVHFNASHSGDYAVFAITRAGEAGVDIERIRDDMPRRDDIAQRYFAPGEQRQLFALAEPERARAFFKLWTRKEAFVKARGTGLFSGLDQFEVALDTPRVTHGGAPGENFWMAELPPVPGYAGAVVVRASSCVAQFWKWRAEETPR